MTEKTSEAKQLMELGYSNRAIELYQDKVNVGVIENPDAGAVFLSPSGDLIRLYIKFNSEIVEDAKFLCYGCPGSSSAMSALTILIKNNPLSEAKTMTEEDIVKSLEGLPEAKQDCATLSIKILQKAIAEYEKTNSNHKM
jgi:nitrogen fixation protein NifU and related proteins